MLATAKTAGAGWAAAEVVRLPLAGAAIFEDWLDHNEPAKKAKVLDRIRSVHGGRLNDPRFGKRMSGEGIFMEQIRRMFEVARRKAGLPEDGPELPIAVFRGPAGNQFDPDLQKPAGI
jgi:DNA repair photolyase